jgi:SulP family sulfate permease
VANAASALTGGLSATGAIARTATNARAGARPPVAVMLHAVSVLAMLLFAPWAAAVPLAALSAVLLVVAWNMSEFERLKPLWRLPRGDRAVLLITLVLIVVVDLTVAMEVGVVLAAFLFMVRMSGVVELESGLHVLDEDELPEESGDQRRAPTAGVEAFRVSGPLFFAVANRLEDAFRQYPEPPKVCILRMRRVPLIDASGTAVIERAHAWRARHGGQLVISGLGTQPRRVLERSGLLAKPGVHVAPDDPGRDRACGAPASRAGPGGGTRPRQAGPVPSAFESGRSGPRDPSSRSALP